MDTEPHPDGERRRLQDAFVDRLDGIDSSFAKLETRMETAESRLDGLDRGQTHMIKQNDETLEELAENTAATSKAAETADRIEVDTRELIDIVSAFKGAARVATWAAWVGSKIFWIGLPGAVAYGGWAAFKAYVIGTGKI